MAVWMRSDVLAELQREDEVLIPPDLLPELSRFPQLTQCRVLAGVAHPRVLLVLAVLVVRVRRLSVVRLSPLLCSLLLFIGVVPTRLFILLIYLFIYLLMP